ncbi:MAG: hypothetical protein H6900_01055 [Rhodobacter sp.]|uniref:hypothetical protein n=1 Tax=Pararhodobacter sp. TaxID=2127056 RepID=UPI002B7EA8A1|nr:hypothetical protein [Pararhodobacter sp.]MCC0071853.1 hypothetical protein [Rhodobacter sp.]HPD91559.1 hypothetical protein [Pararhodobacter sp.]
MPLEQPAAPSPRPAPTLTDRPHCLDCPDCAGTCWSVIELCHLPEMILHSPRKPRA